MLYKVIFEDGTEYLFPDYGVVLDELDDMGYEAIGHPCDLKDGGDRTLFWRNWQDANLAENDPGHKAAGEIRMTGMGRFEFINDEED